MDDHPLVGDGIATMIKDVDYLQLLPLQRTGKEALQFLQSVMPDIILLDINLPDTDGLVLCKMIKERISSTKVIALTSTNEAGIIAQFLAEGGNGYLLKDMERGELLTAIDKVMQGKIFLSAAANESILQKFHNVRDATHSIPILTRRENEILQLLYQGLTGPQIAAKLFLSPYTIETHRKNLMQKLNVNNTQQMLKMAMDIRLIK